MIRDLRFDAIAFRQDRGAAEIDKHPGGKLDGKSVLPDVDHGEGVRAVTGPDCIAQHVRSVRREGVVRRDDHADVFGGVVVSFPARQDHFVDEPAEILCGLDAFKRNGRDAFLRHGFEDHRPAVRLRRGLRFHFRFGGRCGNFRFGELGFFSDSGLGRGGSGFGPDRFCLRVCRFRHG